MENRINEAYVDNLSKYVHLLTVNEIFEEIKKVKAFIKNLRLSNRYEENKKDLYKEAINTENNLSKLYFQKVLNNKGILVLNLSNEIVSANVS